MIQFCHLRMAAREARFTIYGRRDIVLKKMTYCAHANLWWAADFFRTTSHNENTLSLPD